MGGARVLSPGLGLPVGAWDALAWGLVNERVPASDPLAKAEVIAQSLAAHPRAESAPFLERPKTDEAREAFAAFARRRPSGLQLLSRIGKALEDQAMSVGHHGHAKGAKHFRPQGSY